MFKEGANADHKQSVLYQGDFLWRNANMCATHGANRFVNCAESLPAYRVQRHTCSQNLHVKAGILYYSGKFGVLKGMKVEVFEVCWDEFFEKIKVVINCVTRSNQIKLNCFEIELAFGTSKLRKFKIEKFWGASYENPSYVLGHFYSLKIRVLK